VMSAGEALAPSLPVCVVFSFRPVSHVLWDLPVVLSDVSKEIK
jgi:hypothetical protein